MPEGGEFQPPVRNPNQFGIELERACGDCALLQMVPLGQRRVAGMTSICDAPDVEVEFDYPPNHAIPRERVEFASTDPLAPRGEKVADLNASLARCTMRRAAGEPAVTEVFVTTADKPPRYIRCPGGLLRAVSKPPIRAMIVSRTKSTGMVPMHASWPRRIRNRSRNPTMGADGRTRYQKTKDKQVFRRINRPGSDTAN